MASVLIVEDDDDTRVQLEQDVAGDGHVVTSVAGGSAALQAVAQTTPDLIVLDLALPDIDGMDVCRRIRDSGLSMPIVILSGKRDLATRVMGLDSGADDYVLKPPDVRELLARIRRHSTRFLSPARTRSGIAHRGLWIDVSAEQVWRDGIEVDLTAKEFEILALLALMGDQPVSRETLLEKVWGYSTEITTRAIDTHVANLRRKLECDPADPKHILTVHGRGYKFVTSRS